MGEMTPDEVRAEGRLAQSLLIPPPAVMRSGIAALSGDYKLRLLQLRQLACHSEMRPALRRMIRQFPQEAPDA